jgi:tryptophan synthase alpha chain
VLDRPIYCGVGIHKVEDVKMAKESGTDAVFVGSTILQLQDDKPKLVETIKEFLSQC